MESSKPSSSSLIPQHPQHEECQYDPLPDPHRTIRLCRFSSLPTRFKSGISLEIQAHDLSGLDGPASDLIAFGNPHCNTSGRARIKVENVTLGPPNRYVAVSYTWGSPNAPKVVISINQKKFKVSTNLAQLLAVFSEADRRKEQPGRQLFWIDQICIDQQNLTERNAQVQLMGFIYATAEAVYAWLGPESSSSQLGLQTLGHLPIVSGPEASLSPDVLRGIEAVWELFQREYWARLWIVQEAVLAQKLVLCCGPHELVFTDPRDTETYVEGGGLDTRTENAFVERLELSEDARSILASRMHLLGNHIRQQNRPLNGAFWVFSDPISVTYDYLPFQYACRDPLDRVFALQSLIQPNARIAVDYSLSAEEVFNQWVIKAASLSPSVQQFPEESRFGIKMLARSMGLGEISERRVDQLLIMAKCVYEATLLSGGYQEVSIEQVSQELLRK